MRGLFRSVLLFGTAFLVGAAGSPNGRPQQMQEHRPPHTYVPQTFAPAISVNPGAVRRPYSGTPIDVLTYHYDSSRTGWNPSESDLTSASVASAKFGLLSTLSVDGNVFAQPLLVTGMKFADGSTHDVLLIVTGHNSVYAFDAQNYAPLWKISLGTAQKTADVGCGDVKPEYGISSTPAIVRNGTGATVYVVAGTEPSQYDFHTWLHALDITTGQDTISPVEISPSAKLSDKSALTFDPQNQWNRASLALNNGQLYVGIGSHCDHNDSAISGWLLRYDLNLNLLKAFHTIETPHKTTELASIWMTGYAPALDPSGNVFVATGNGDYTTGARDWGESVLKLAPDLSKVLSRFTPADYNSLNQSDVDFGSGGVMLLPAVTGQVAPPMAVAVGKEGALYLLNQNALGGLKPNDSGALDSQSIGGVWGGPAFYNGPNGPTVFAQGDTDVLKAFTVSPAARRPKLSLSLLGTSNAGYGGSLPIVSSNGALAGTGVVWLIARGTQYGLEAYDASRLGDPIFTAAGGTWSNRNGQNPFLTPMEANGRVYVTGYKQVQVFGLSE